MMILDRLRWWALARAVRAVGRAAERAHIARGEILGTLLLTVFDEVASQGSHGDGPVAADFLAGVGRALIDVAEHRKIVRVRARPRVREIGVDLVELSMALERPEPWIPHEWRWVPSVAKGPELAHRNRGPWPPGEWRWH